MPSLKDLLEWAEYAKPIDNPIGVPGLADAVVALCKVAEASWKVVSADCIAAEVKSLLDLEVALMELEPERAAREALARVEAMVAREKFRGPTTTTEEG